jgi:Ca2+-binding RTX toxin-like protein
VEGSIYNDTLSGTEGNNEMSGGAGDDSITAGGGFDELRGNAGNDTLRGGAGNDNLHGGSGNDLIDGGADFDTVVYYNQDEEAPTSGIVANLASGAVTGGWGNDTLVGIENLIGSNFADTVAGTSGNNFIDLGDGNDTVDGGAGDDQLNGGSGTDRVSFASASAGVFASLLSNSATGGAGNDSLFNFEQIRGSTFDDTLIGGFQAELLDGNAGNDAISGGNSNDTLFGGEGNDTLDGEFGDDSLLGGNGDDSLLGGDGFDTLKGEAGNDTLDGGANINGSTFDMADYRDAGSAVTATLGGFSGTGSASGGGIGVDTLRNMEGVLGSDFNDSLTGGDTGDMFSGQGGDDTIDGAGGFDIVHYGFASSAFNTAAIGVTVNLGTGVVSGGWGNDRLISIEGVIGSNFSDSITGDATGNFIRGALGDDTIDGGAGRDTSAYDFSNGSTRASLVTNTATGANGNDVLISIENLRGGDFNDTLEGDNNSNQLEGRAGNDLLIGNGGNDTLNGENGNDTLQGGAGPDLINGGAGNDSLDGGQVLDRVNLTDGNSLTFFGAFQAAQLSLQLGMANDGQNGQDVLAVNTFNFITGTNFNDLLVGRAGGLFESFEGGLGDDTIDGGKTVEADRSDTARVQYTNSGSAVQVNLAAGTATGGQGNDTLINITYVRGSQSGDELIGSDRTDLTETFEGRGGADTIHGGGGFDQVRYSAAVSAVNVNLVTGTATDGETTVSTDTFDGIEGARGSNFNDTLTGGNAANGTTNTGGLEFFQGEGGNDQIDGGQGYDRIDYTSIRRVSARLCGWNRRAKPRRRPALRVA